MTGGDLPFQPGDDPFANLPLFGDLAKAFLAGLDAVKSPG